MELNINILHNALTLLGQRLAYVKTYYELVAIGGGSLLLLGYINRTTRDLDLLAFMEQGCLMSANPIPKILKKEIELVGTALEIGEQWINAGPTFLLEAGLPEGFEKRLIRQKYDNLTIHFAGRLDQIHFKLYAAVDQGPSSKHFIDLIRLNPTKDELLAAKEWSLTQDVSLEFSQTLDQALKELGVTDGNN